MAVVWCVESREGFCQNAYQPKGKPRYRDSVKTVCGYVILPAGFEKRKPTCPDCLANRKMK